jgi:D-alanyl-D-alanine carboxypeptidase
MRRLNRRWLAVLAVATLPAAGYALAAPAVGATPAATTARIAAWQDRARTAVSVAVVQPDGARTTWVEGTAGAGAPPLTASTQFRMASITKLFVATVVLQLVAEGELNLEEPVERHVSAPGMPVGVTVRQLLNHTSGLPDYGTPDFSKGLVRQPDRRWTARDVLATLHRRRPDFAPGTNWRYSNSNYVVLGEMITAVTGRPWAAEVRARLLDPLGLRDTYVAGAEAPRGAGLISTAYFDLDNDGDYEDIENGAWPALESSEGPAGALVSTPSDIATFTAALFSSDVLDDQLLREMTTGTPFARRYDDYGLGVELRRPDLLTLVWGHGGFLPGYRSATWYVPSRGTTITVATNDSRADAGDVAELVLGRLP